jgi:classical protein kinase C/novel protein kinase C epsilon type
VFLAAAQERHPFLLGLHSCFQTETRIYFVMEYVSGGDLMLHIQKKQFTLRQAKFYACEVLLALEYFHQMGIIYRDLKLDNILLTLDGHVKVADYGLCKEDMWFGKTTSTFCGTPEFMAPEVSCQATAQSPECIADRVQILLEQRYGRAVDWWAFGVLTYEMLLGQSPFRGEDEDEIFDAILEDEPLYPITMPRDAVSLLQRVSGTSLIDFQGRRLCRRPLTLCTVVDSRPDSPTRCGRGRRQRNQSPPVLQRRQL